MLDYVSSEDSSVIPEPFGTANEASSDVLLGMRVRVRIAFVSPFWGTAHEKKLLF